MVQKIFLGFLIVLILAVAPSVFAGKVELTTYYPAPFGEYKQLKATGSTTNNSVVALEARGSTGIGLVVTDANNVGIGTNTPGAILDITSTTSGFLPPRMTTAQRDLITATSVPPLAQGMVIFNTTTNQLEVNKSAEIGRAHV